MSTKIKTIIVDDEEISRSILANYVKKTNDLELINSFANGIDAANYIRETNVELIFLDVEMPGMSGLDFLHSLDAKPNIILTTSKKEYAVEAFELNVIDYLVKPISYSRFLKSLNKITSKSQVPSQKEVIDFIFIKVESKLIKIKLDTIDFIEAQGDYVKIHTEEKNFITHSKMKTIEEKLPSQIFTRLHRSYFVNINKIKDIEDNNLMIGKSFIPISSSYKDQLFQKLKIL